MSQNKKHIDLSVEFCGIKPENPFIPGYVGTDDCLHRRYACGK